MSRKPITRWIVGAAALIALVFAAVVPVAAAAPAKPDKAKKVIAVEVAEDPTRFVFTTERLFDDGMPQYGTPFITQGYLYPAGTLDGTNGVLADGSPEFPELVIGDWTCFGWLIGDGAHTTTGRMVVSTQIFSLADDDESAVIATNGYELVDVGVPVHRVINGGTGKFTGIEGEQVQQLLGFTDQMGVNLSVEFQLK